MNVKNITLKSIRDIQKQVDKLSAHSAFNTGYLNEYQNNTLGDDPEWSKKNSYILDHGAGGGTASYLINKPKWINQLNKSKQLQVLNLEKVDDEITNVKKEMQEMGCL